MVRQSVQCCGNTNHTRGADDDESNQEQDAGDLFDNSPADELPHVRNAVAARVIGLELSLNESTPGVQELPTKHVDGAWKSPESVHGGWNRENTSREDNYKALRSA